MLATGIQAQSAAIAEMAKAQNAPRVTTMADPVTGQAFPRMDDIPFFKKQMRLLIGRNNEIDPTSIDDYIILNGYQPLAKALKIDPEKIIEMILRSGLRGRGGGGFVIRC